MTAPSRATKQKTASARKTPARSTGVSGQRGRQTRSRGGTTATAEEHAATVPVPVVTPHVKIYKVRVPMPGMSYAGDAGRAIAGYLPPPDRLLFYGGLGVAAVFGAIDWPVAAAIGIGTMIARRATSGRGPGRSRATRSPRSAQSG